MFPTWHYLNLPQTHPWKPFCWHRNWNFQLETDKPEDASFYKQLNQKNSFELPEHPAESYQKSLDRSSWSCRPQRRSTPCPCWARDLPAWKEHQVSWTPSGWESPHQGSKSFQPESTCITQWSTKTAGQNNSRISKKIFTEKMFPICLKTSLDKNIVYY